VIVKANQPAHPGSDGSPDVSFQGFDQSRHLPAGFLKDRFLIHHSDIHGAEDSGSFLEGAALNGRQMIAVPDAVGN
jgi:hypothetical protein